MRGPSVEPAACRIPVVAESPIQTSRLWKNRSKRDGREPCGQWLGRGRPRDWNLRPGGYGPYELIKHQCIWNPREICSHDLFTTRSEKAEPRLKCLGFPFR
jgi:hypothetical protein